MPTEDVRQDAGWLLFFLLIFLVRGVLYAAVTPPWQAPDEPRHMEFVLSALDPPSANDAAGANETKLIRSLVAHRWWKHVFGTPLPTVPPRSLGDIPYQQGDQSIRQPPAYYWAAGGFLRLWRSDDVVQQLLAVRIFSLVLVGTATAATYVAGRMAFPDRRAVAVLATSFVALAPMPAFIGASANNDALAIAVGSLLFMLVAGLLTRSRLRTAVITCALLGLGTLSKATAAPALLIGGLTVAAVLVRRVLPQRVLSLLVLGGLVGFLVLAVLVWEPSAPAGWGGWGITSTLRIDLPDADGGSALRVEDANQADYVFASQSIPRNRFYPLRGREVFLTVSVRCEGADRRAFIQLRATEPFANVTGVTGARWTTASLRATVPTSAPVLLVDLGSAANGPGDTGICYFRDVQLAPAANQLARAPRLGVAAEEPEGNLVENGSGSTRRLVPGAWVAKTQLGALLSSPSLTHALDPVSYSSRWSPDYLSLATQAFESYWGKFGWLTIPVEPTWYAVWYWVCAVAGAGLIFGVLGSLVVHRGVAWGSRQQVLTLFAGAGILAVALVWLRFVPITASSGWPQGRYLFPELVVFSVLLATGLVQLVPRALDRALVPLGILTLIVFDASSLLLSIVPAFYRGS